jgi:hypothetical protein
MDQPVKVGMQQAGADLLMQAAVLLIAFGRGLLMSSEQMTKRDPSRFACDRRAILQTTRRDLV